MISLSLRRFTWPSRLAIVGIVVLAFGVIGAQRPLPEHLKPQRQTSTASLAASSIPGTRFVHTATASNINGNTTYIDHPLLNNNPDAIVLVTQNWNPGGVGSTYNNHAIGVWYDGAQKKWGIFNQDLANMPEGADFNVLIPDPSANAFVHTAQASNTVANTTYIDNPLTNNNPDAIVLVTQNWNPGGGGGTYNDHAIGVWYNNVQKKWAIFNQDLANMPVGADFNVVVADSTTAFVHKATGDNSNSQTTYIDHPLLNGNPNAIVLVTQNWNPGGVGGTYNDHAIGVFYSTSKGKWAIFNQDLASMPENASFNVTIPDTNTDVFVHTATNSNTSGSVTTIDHPLLNEDPNAIVLVTQNWNPPGSNGTYNDEAIGVYYSAGLKKWRIFNQSTANIPSGASFNVLIPPPGANVFVHTATASNINGNTTYIDHPLLNNRPNATVLVTQNWNPGGMGGTYNDHNIGVWYDDAEKKWAIFNQDSANMPVGADFNVLVLNDLTALPGSKDAFVQTATASNISNHWTAIDHPLTNQLSMAFVFATLNWNPGGSSGTKNDHPIGVWYNDVQKKWAIFNQDFANMPEGADFNVLVVVRQIYLPIVDR